MSDNDLIREAREWYGHGDLPSLTGNLLTRLADALEAAVTREENLREGVQRIAAHVLELVARVVQLEKAIGRWTYDHAETNATGKCSCSLCIALAGVPAETEEAEQ